MYAAVVHGERGGSRRPGGHDLHWLDVCLGDALDVEALGVAVPSDRDGVCPCPVDLGGRGWGWGRWWFRAAARGPDFRQELTYEAGERTRPLLDVDSVDLGISRRPRLGERVSGPDVAPPF